MKAKKQIENTQEKEDLAYAMKIRRDNSIRSHGKVFEGVVLTKHPRRVSIGFERSVYVKKYERYAKNKTKVHARLTEKLKDQINVGDRIKVQECRPLSKIIHFVVLGKVEKNLEKNKK